MRCSILIFVLLSILVASCVEVPSVDKSESEPPVDTDPPSRHSYIHEDDLDADAFIPSGDKDECSSVLVTYETDRHRVDGRKLISTLGGLSKRSESESIPPIEMEQVDAVYLDAARVKMLEGEDFDFVEGVFVWGGAKGQVSKTEENLVAWRESVPTNSREFELRTDGQINLKSAVEAGAVLRYDIYARPPSDTVRMKGEVDFISVVCPDG